MGGTNLPRLTLPVTLMFERISHFSHALIDSGSEKNLLDSGLATRLGLPIVQ